MGLGRLYILKEITKCLHWTNYYRWCAGFRPRLILRSTELPYRNPDPDQITDFDSLIKSICNGIGFVRSIYGNNRLYKRLYELVRKELFPTDNNLNTDSTYSNIPLVYRRTVLYTFYMLCFNEIFLGKNGECLKGHSFTIGAILQPKKGMAHSFYVGRQEDLITMHIYNEIKEKNPNLSVIEIDRMYYDIQLKDLEEGNWLDIKKITNG